VPTPPTSIPRIPVEERLFSLVLALIASEIGLTKSDILATVQGYRQRFLVGGDNSSLERQFERDKDDIRELGIPLETIEASDEPGSNHNLRYRIPKGQYDLPLDVTFSPNELMHLKLAAAVWREGSLSLESRRALTKLSSLGVESADPVIGYAPHLRAQAASFEPLNKAMDRSQTVSFDYLKPGETTPKRRTVDPAAIVLHDGRWHLYGTDHTAGTWRTFLLTRIVSPVTALAGKTFTPAPEGTADVALTELQELWQSQVARIRVLPGSDAEVRLRKRHDPLEAVSAPADYVLALHYSDFHIFADELAGFGPEAFVLSPQPLANAVRDRLLRVVAVHQDNAAVDPGTSRLQENAR
jgi:proteasome accessory factor B